MNNKVLKGSLLVAGTSIGGGMLALPVELSLGGFIPSIVIYFFCWILMACTGLLFLEVSLWIKNESNIITMAKNTLGLKGEIFAWILYLFQFYLLTIAYISGCGALLTQVFTFIPEHLGPLIFVLCFAPFIYFGAKVVGKINVFFMIGLGLCYLLFVFLGVSHINLDNLHYHNWNLSLVGLPVAFTAFAYQGTVPTLMYYLDYKPKDARYAILIGSALPFITYVIWQALILGIVPTYGPGGLREAFLNGDNAIHPLRLFVGSPYIYVIGQFFAFFAMVTSFFGVTLGLLDFLSDGLKIKKTSVGKLILCGLVFIPPLLISSYNPRLFLVALGFAGGFGCALLLGLLPIIMVWVGRYHLGYQSSYRLWGGKNLLKILAAFIVFEVCIQILLIFNFFAI